MSNSLDTTSTIRCTSTTKKVIDRLTGKDIPKSTWLARQVENNENEQEMKQEGAHELITTLRDEYNLLLEHEESRIKDVSLIIDYAEKKAELAGIKLHQMNFRDYFASMALFHKLNNLKIKEIDWTLETVPLVLTHGIGINFSRLTAELITRITLKTNEYLVVGMPDLSANQITIYLKKK